MHTIAIVGDFLFPFGSAAAARIRNLAIGCAEHGVKVSIFPMAQVEPPVGYDGLGPFLLERNIQWAYPQFSPGWSEGRPGWAPEGSVPGKLWWYRAVRHSAKAVVDYLRSAESINSSDVVLLYGRGWSRLEPVVRLCRERGARVFLDSVEILDRFDGFGGCASPIWWDWRLGTQRLPALVDGVTAISRPIEAWNISRGARRTLILPAIESWGCPPRSYPAECDKPFFVAYLGALTTKDDPETMLAAMRLLAEENVPVRLKIAGAYAKTAGGKRYIAKVNADPVLREVVIFSGYLADGERESWLASSDALILLRSDSLAEKHSFPTRLPESLRTGLPVITSDVGDMAWHLRDGVDAAVVPPGNPRALAAVLRGLAAKDDRGREMGLSGWFRGAERFDRRRHARAFLDFVDDCS